MKQTHFQLQTVLRIRSIRVRRQAAMVAESENKLKQQLTAQQQLQRDLIAIQENHVQTRRAKLEKLKGGQTNIREFLELKDSENTFDWKRNQMTREGDVLGDQIQQSRVDWIAEKTKYKELEKASIKVEEYLKLDWT
ncbi:MAG: hypothetical protein V7542_10515 [Limnobacter sp.]|jgi:hypothetical protein|uniref:hypothetical protein n=1 Tax=unclassified Limnobacter TaxID=2630203 RepID=UPI001DB65934|nr:MULTISPECIES: hypothetical protein [unclassified Limnobacter]MBA4315727.1 hypothetical protein [Alcaligenaceae bacterium]MDZ4050729.1 hypothetical protein [Limnobacter sp.]|tara:strand:- start:6484 stop:6894 length:411 start_codon:yes stop_codon:yes gene_type:complete